jgi:LuxR family transcriptional regulator, maltose regulon positive regulatory protein
MYGFMEKQVTRTKVVPPRQRADLYSRPRLLTLFDELTDYRLVMMIAPAGYGKTTMLVDFAHTSPMKICWYSIDTLDRDPPRFLAHFVAAITQRFPSFGAVAWAALHDLANGQQTLEQFITTIVNELYDHVTEHFVLILDDYHLVNDTDPINEFISQLVQQAPETCHIVLASRQLVGLPQLALMVARGYVSGLDYEELAFTADEIQQFIGRNFKHTISHSEAQKLAEATAGWITGLLLSAESKITNIAGRMRRLRAAGVDLYDYLAQQVLDQQQPLIREFLLHTAVLEEFDTQLCEAILGRDWLPAEETWENLITLILRRNLFVLPVGTEGTWVRYHPLFLEFLQKRFAYEYPAKELPLYERLADYYRAQEEWEKAHRLYLRFSNFSAIAALIEESGLNLLQIGRTGLLVKWLTDLLHF